MSQVLNNEVDILNVANIDNDIRDSYARAMIAGEEKETYCTRQGGYDVNEFFIWTDRQIYKTKAAISQGDTFVLNTNIELAGTLSDQMYQLFSQSPESMRAVLSNIESGSTASRNFVKGEYILWTDGFLYEVTANTNIGTAWAVGTNITKKNNITDEITSLNNDLTNEVETRAKIGAHNMLFANLETAKATSNSGTWSNNVYTINGGTVTLNDDCSFIIDGTFSANSEFGLVNRFSGRPLKAGTYKVIGGISNASVTISTTRNNSYYVLGTDGGDGATITVNSTDGNIGAAVTIKAGTYNNLKMGIQIILPTDPFTEYTPYAMTNRELTENVVTNSDGFTPATDSSSFKSNLSFLKRIGNLCVLTVQVSTQATIGTSLNIGTLAQGSRPSKLTVGTAVVIKGGTGYISPVEVYTNGNVVLGKTYETDNWYYGQVIFTLD